MRKRTRGLIIAAAAVVVLAGVAVVVGPRLYAQVNSNLAGEAPTLTAPATSPADLTTLTATGEISSGSQAGYRVNEVLNGEQVTVRGTTDQVAGTLTIESGTLTAAQITVDVASIATGVEARDRYFRDTALEATTHPTAEFILTAPVALPTDSDTVALTGDLTIHGVTRSVTLEAQMSVDEANARGQVIGTIPLTFSDFGVTAPDLGFVKVEAQGSAEFDLAIALTE